MNKKVYELIQKETSEKILEWRNCLWCSNDFPIFELQDIIEKKMI